MLLPHHQQVQLLVLLHHRQTGLIMRSQILAQVSHELMPSPVAHALNDIGDRCTAWRHQSRRRRSFVRIASHVLYLPTVAVVCVTL